MRGPNKNFDSPIELSVAGSKTSENSFLKTLGVSFDNEDWTTVPKSCWNKLYALNHLKCHINLDLRRQLGQLLVILRWPTALRPPVINSVEDDESRNNNGITRAMSSTSTLSNGEEGFHQQDDWSARELITLLMIEDIEAGRGRKRRGGNNCRRNR